MHAFIAAIAVLGAACQLPYRGGARRAEGVALDDHWIHAVPTPVIRQLHETDCGLAALAMVAGAWGETWTVDELARRLPAGDHGVKLGALRELARARGLEAYALAGTPGDLAHELRAGRPVVIGLVLPFDRGRDQSHYEVAIALDPDDGTVITIDPASGAWMRRSRAVLDAEWRGARYAALVVTGDHRAGMADARTTTRGDSP